ncbi:MAG: glycoside hydrolase family 15 protein, partial [Nitriliruptorales bacterium]|nr:glycoside hydrolase family 15 protein [Nitriliruptorales bacterium]
TIEWLCIPRFDHAAAMAAMLGDEQHGMWVITPVNGPRTTERAYRNGTMVLDTTIAADDGTIRITDCMPPTTDEPCVIRRVEGLEGSTRVHVQIVMSMDYGTMRPVVRHDDGRVLALAGPDGLVLDADIDLVQHEQSTVADLTIEEGDAFTIVLSHYESSQQPPPPLEDPAAAIDDAQRWWCDWSDQLEFDGDYTDELERSMLVLKAMTHAPSGGIVTSPTTSLPEELGGERNWDYRYCWMRDSALSMYVLMLGGFHDEARAWRRWLVRTTTARADKLQPVFGPAGERRIEERTADWLPGYEGSTPVNIGNGAGQQFQLDAYGEVVDALYAADKLGLEPDEEAWAFQKDVAAFLQDHWTRPGQGIWELRGPPRQFVHSKLMAWVAIDRVIRSAEEFDHAVDDETLLGWEDLRETIRREVEERGWNEEVGAFTQVYGGQDLDAALLLMPQTGFLPADDERFVSTVEAIQRKLVHDGWVWRFDNNAVDDGLSGGEGAFIACQCWLADALYMMGREDEARQTFERVLEVSNDLGLLSEEYDPRPGRLLGNFPLALTHLAVANAIHNFSGEGPAHHRAGL